MKAIDILALLLILLLCFSLLGCNKEELVEPVAHTTQCDKMIYKLYSSVGGKYVILAEFNNWNNITDTLNIDSNTHNRYIRKFIASDRFNPVCWKG